MVITMECILLAAGYATRLYPLTENMPKALLTLGDRTILDFVIDQVETVDEVNTIYIVTNHKFYINFCEWANTYKGKKNIKVINDFTTSNDNRLGAIGDMKYVVDKEQIDDEILVMASDNIFDFPLMNFVNMYHEKNADMICAHVLEDKSQLHSQGVVELDENDRVIGFEEKPEHPKSDMGVPPFYLYRRETLALLEQYLKEGNNPDAPGNFVPWLKDRVPVYAYRFNSMCIDIGTPENYYETKEKYETK